MFNLSGSGNLRGFDASLLVMQFSEIGQGLPGNFTGDKCGRLVLPCCSALAGKDGRKGFQHLHHSVGLQEV